MNLRIYIILLFFITTPNVRANRPEWVDQMIQRKFENRPELFDHWEDSQGTIHILRNQKDWVGGVGQMIMSYHRIGQV